MRLKEQQPFLNFHRVVLTILLTIFYFCSVNCYPRYQSPNSEVILFENKGIFRNSRDDSIIFNENETPIKTNSRRCPTGSTSSETEVQRYYFHKATNKCYQGGSQGPCNSNMIFGTDYTSEEGGECTCGKSGPQGQMLVYDALTNQCFPIYTQGICWDEEWIVLDKFGKKFHCENNPCKSESNQYQVPFENRCVDIGVGAPECDKGETIGFLPTETNPTCIFKNDNEVAWFASGAIKRNCKRGTSRSYNGNCVPNFVW